MVIRICEKCQQRFQSATTNTDYVHECHGGDLTLDNEDVLWFGQAFEDHSGSGTVVPSAPGVAGVSDELQGTDAGVRGGEFGGVTRRGNKAELYRQRKRRVYKDLSEDPETI